MAWKQVNVKYCRKCETTKSIDDFYTDHRYGTKMGTCKKCIGEDRKRRREELIVQGHYIVDKKKCSKCGGIFDINKFYRDRGQPDGRAPKCKMCTYTPKEKEIDPMSIQEQKIKAKTRTKLWRQNNPDKVKFYQEKAKIERSNKKLNPVI